MASNRPRGFKSWNPQYETKRLIAQVQQILDDYSDILPLTLRQVFYILVSDYHYDKTEQAYGRLTEMMNRARRAQMIPMSSIRDDGFVEKCPTGWADYDEFVGNVRAWAERLERERQDGQPVYLMIWCEARGMMPQLANAVREWHIPVLSSGGFDSTTTKHDMAKRIAEHDDVEILHVGDHDPSGVHICSSLDEDLQAFLRYYGGNLTVTRLAVTPEQVATMNLPTAPPKRTDQRSFEGHETTQAEAIPPRELRRIVRDAVLERIDIDILNDVKAEEQAIRDKVLKWVEKMEEDS